jgi:hypothetical protein
VAEQQKKAKIVDDPTVAETYSNQLVSIAFDGGAVLLTFGISRAAGDDPAQVPIVKVNSRAVLPARAALELERGLAKLRAGLVEAAKRASADNAKKGKETPEGARQ